MNQLKSALAAIAVFAAAPALAQTVLDATLGEASQKTAEVSTKELRQIIADGTAVVLDARPPLEYAISHIPGALNVAPKPGLAAHQYVSDVAEVGRLVGGAKDRPLVLYCNGPFCGKVKRLGAELVQAGYTNVRRYQLGTPGWRALGGAAMETELEALPYINNDKTAVWIDARSPDAFASGSIAGARNVPASQLAAGKDQGVMQQAKDDGRLPMDDHNTRIIVFGADGKQARAVADAIATEAFHNVSYLSEPFEALRQVSAQAHPGHGSGGTSSQPVITPIMRSARTISGQPLRLPKEEAEVAAAAVHIPAGGALPIHRHPWSRFVYVERGSLRVHNHDTGASLDFQAGQVLPEVVAQWHEARALGSGPVRLIVIDLVPPGVNNTIMKGAATAR
ncbi:MAG TPA: rhodanese-like domain-containing protein [Allosphingosinicella sp.]|nr:rhodanese-like domain-containing protein [Allosphingosinicella sp.]